MFRTTSNNEVVIGTSPLNANQGGHMEKQEMETEMETEMEN